MCLLMILEKVVASYPVKSEITVHNFMLLLEEVPFNSLVICL
jgi:hypothetical protein